MTNTNTDKLALHGGTPVRGEEKVWPKWPVYDATEEQALLDVLHSGKWFYGERVAAFERAYADFQDAAHCISANSGTSALEIVLEALGIGPGDEVIIPPYTFVATASAVMRVGAVPVFADLDLSWCLDPQQVRAAISKNTRAIMPVHFGGRISDMDRFTELAREHGIPIIEDACHSWGGKWKKKGTGALGTAGVFSFQMSKNMTAGEGGAILTDDDELADVCRSISNCGRDKTGPWYHHVRVGTNARMTEFQAAVLEVQLNRLPEQTALRERNGALLNAELSEIDGIRPQPGSNRMTCRPYHLYCLRIDGAAFGCGREAFVEAARAEGLPVSAGYPLPLYEQPALKEYLANHKYPQYQCPMAEDLCYTSGMWLTHEVLLGSEEDMWDIVAIVKKIKDHARDLRE